MSIITAIENLSTRLDDYKRIGKNQRGQKCGRGWTGLKGACQRNKKNANKGDLKRQSAMALAAKIRKERGLPTKGEVALKRISGSEERLAKAAAASEAPKRANQTARARATKARNQGDKAYWEFSRSTSAKQGGSQVAAMVKANRERGAAEEKAGAARIWNRPYSKKSEGAFGYKGQAVHKRQVERALKAGKKVPKDVLAQYPDLQPKKTKAKKPPKSTPETRAALKVEKASLKRVGQSAESARLKKLRQSGGKVGYAAQHIAVQTGRKKQGYTSEKSRGGQVLEAQRMGREVAAKESARKAEAKALELSSGSQGAKDELAAKRKAKEARTTENTNLLNAKQGTELATQLKEQAKIEGRAKDAAKWAEEERRKRRTELQIAQQAVNTTQKELFGITEVSSDMPLFSMQDSADRVDAKTARQKKVSKVMREFKRGDLNIGKSDEKVKSRRQAIAIALSEAGVSRKRPQSKQAKG